MYRSVFVSLRKTARSMDSTFRINKTSKNEIILFLSSSYVNLMLSWYAFKTDSTCSLKPFFTKHNVSSTYLFHRDKNNEFINPGTMVFSSSTMKIPAITGPKGEPMATPSSCWQHFPSNVKQIFLVHSKRRSFISFLGMLVCTSFSS